MFWEISGFFEIIRDLLSFWSFQTYCCLYFCTYPSSFFEISRDFLSFFCCYVFSFYVLFLLPVQSSFAILHAPSHVGIHLHWPSFLVSIHLPVCWGSINAATFMVNSPQIILCFSCYIRTCKFTKMAFHTIMCDQTIIQILWKKS